VDDMIAKSMLDVEHSQDFYGRRLRFFGTYNIKLNPKKYMFAVRSGKFLSIIISNRGIKANPDKVKAV